MVAQVLLLFCLEVVREYTDADYWSSRPYLGKAISDPANCQVVVRVLISAEI